jgi:hypothetical protein
LLRPNFNIIGAETPSEVNSLKQFILQGCFTFNV